MEDQLKAWHDALPGLPPNDCIVDEDFLSLGGDSIGAIKPAAQEFWRRRLEGVSPCLFPLKSMSGNDLCQHHVARHRIRLADTKSSINRSQILLAAWALVVARNSESEDFAFGAAVNDRAASVEIVGPAIATVPIRARVHRDKNVVTFLEEIRDYLTDMIPFEHTGLQNIGSLGSDAQTACDFQNLVVIQPRLENHNLHNDIGLTLSDKGGMIDSSYPLLLECQLGDGEVDVIARYDPDCISDEYMSRIIRQFEHCSNQLSLKSINQSLGEIDVLSPEEKDQLLKWNAEIPEVVDACIHELISKHAAERPNDQAVCSAEINFTFEELESLSSRLANHLISIGITAEMMIPLCFEKSPWAVVSILAVLKAGAAFVALDPSNPINRLNGIVEDVQAPVLLTSVGKKDLLSAPGRHIIHVNRETIEALPTHDSIEPKKRVVTPDNAAYVIFTSGSTGKPKGVVVEHRAWCISSLAHAKAMKMTPSSRVLQFSSYAYGGSLIETLTALIQGACVCLLSEHERVNDFAGAMTRMDISWALLTPSFIRQFTPDQLPSLRTLNIGGEAMSSAEIKVWYGAVTLLNAYGNAETATVCLAKPIDTDDVDPKTIGFPAGVRCWIVDPSDYTSLVPIGCVGELAVEGPTLARGYLNEPEKTAKVFVQRPDWFSEGLEPERLRMYRTGDLVCYTSEGSLNYSGRRDARVKIRGQRIELGEIEEILSRNALLQHAYVAFPSSGRFQDRLIAVISPTSDEVCDSSTEIKPTITTQLSKDETAAIIANVREAISTSLPEVMIPTCWAVIDVMPTNKARKIDRAVLGKFVNEVDEHVYNEIMDISSGTVAINRALSDLEMCVQLLVGRVLAVAAEQVKMTWSFVSMGGDSLSAMKLLSACREQGIELSVQDIIQSKSLLQMAEHAAQSNDGSKTTAFSVDEIDVPFALSPMQSTYFQAMANENSWYNTSVAVKITSPIHPEDLESALFHLVERHDALRLRFSKNDDARWKQCIVSDTASSYRFHYHTIDTLEEMDDIAKANQNCIDIENGPVLVAQLFDADGGQYAYLTASRLVVDVASWDILLEDLRSALDKNYAANISKPSQTFQQWCKVQDKRLSEIDSEVDLDTPPDTDYLNLWGLTTNNNKYGETATESFALSPELTNLLVDDSNISLRTDFIDLCVAALAESFQSLSLIPDNPTFHLNSRDGSLSDATTRPRIVGSLSSLSPVNVSTGNIVDSVISVKDARRLAARNDKPGCINHLIRGSNGQETEGLAPVEIIFTYDNRSSHDEKSEFFQPADQIFQQAHQNNIGRDIRRLAIFEVSVSVWDKQAHFSLTYNKNISQPGFIQAWCSRFEETLQLTASQLSTMPPRFTKTDFPLLHLSSSTLDQLVTHKLPSLGLTQQQVEDIYPCSPMQQGLLVSQAKLAGSYNVQLCWEVAGDVTIEEITQAWKIVVNRHTILRTVFVEDITDEALYNQIVLKPDTIDCFVKVYDSKSEEASSSDLFARGVNLPLEYTGKPRHCFSMMQINGTTFCRLDISHALIDGGSAAVLETDLPRALNGQLADLAHSSAVFGQFIKHLLTEPMTANNQYWESYLQGIEPCIMPPLLDDGCQVPSTREERHAKVTIDVSVETISEFCANMGFTSANLLLAAWAITLSIYTGSESVCFGYLTSGRDLPIDGIQDAIGPFMNMLVCRLDIDNQSSTESVLRTVQGDFLQGLQHQICSLAEIQRTLGLAGRALFNSAVSFQSVQKQETESGTRLIRISAKDISEYDVTVKAGYSPDGFDVSIGYTPTFMSDGFASHVASTLGRVLGEIVAKPLQRINDVGLLGDDAQKCIMAWNSAPLSKSELCTHTMFEEIAGKCPDDIAIHGWDGDMTYAELDKTASTLAQHLQAKGVSSGMYVPFMFEKSIWAIVAMLGILKSGAAFVPLSPTHPSSRRDQILQQIEAKFILLSETQDSEWSPRMDIVPITVNKASIDALPALLADFKVTVPSSNAAYVLFTSGSTGTPKGVVIEHDSLSTSLRAQGKTCHISPETRAFQFASYTFDACITEILGPLTHGGCVCVPPEASRLGETANEFNKLKANWALFTPSFLKTMQPEEVPTLRVLVNGGESLDRETLRVWQPVLDHHVNAYGPTEASVMCLTNESISADTNPSCIGKSAAARMWVVDPNSIDRLMPVGSVGELFVQGPILAREYLGDAEKTKKAFITSCPWLPKSTPDGWSCEKLYKTGDLVRYNLDGSLNYIGRKDAQVKIRGQRLELGEIDSHAKSYWEQGPAVTEVIELKQRNNTQHLALFLTVGDSNSTSDVPIVVVDELSDSMRNSVHNVEEQLTKQLPSYMVPSIYITIRQIPLTIAGKTDRRSLKAMADSLTESQILLFTFADQTKSSPSTPMEEVLQKIWAEVLDIPTSSIGREDSFFRLGGDSISAVKLVAAARRFGVLINFAAVFNFPVLADLAEKASTFEDGIDTSADSSDSDGLTPSSVSDDELYEGHRDPVENVERDYPRDAVQRGMVTLIAPVARVSWGEAELAPTETPRYPSLGLVYHREGSQLSATTADSSLSQTVEDIFPCSPLQQDMLISEQKGRGYYNAHFIFEMSDPKKAIDIQRLKQAFNNVVRRHAILRTAFFRDFYRKDRFTQMVLKNCPQNVSILFCGEDENPEQLLRSFQRVDAGSFRPSHRLVLCRTTHDERTLLSLQVNHTVVDGPSISMILRDLSTAYAGTPLQEQEAPSFREHVSYILSQPVTNSLNYWSNYLELCPTQSFLFANSESPRAGKLQTLTFPVESCVKLEKVSEKAGVTLATVYRTAWALLLHRYYESDDVVFGYVVAGRGVPIPNAQEIVGPFLNMLPCRTKISSSKDSSQIASSLLKDVQGDYIASMAHDHISPMQIAASMGRPTDQPMFNTLLNFRSHSSMKEDDALKVTEQHSFRMLWAQDPMEFDLVVTVDDRDGETFFSVNYWDMSMQKADATRIAEDYSAMLSWVMTA